MPETRQEETGRKRASRKIPAARDAAVRPSRRPTTRPGEQAVSHLGEEVIAKEVLGEDLDQELEIVSERGENSIEVGELEDAREMAGEESDLRAILRMMCERDEQYRKDMAETAEMRR